MPKMKSNRGASKRFKVSGTGKLMRRRAGKSHLLSHKTRKRKRRLRKITETDQINIKSVKKLLPNL